MPRRFWAEMSTVQESRIHRHGRRQCPGIPVTVLGATRQDSNIQGIDEDVRISDLVSVTKILARTYLELL